MISEGFIVMLIGMGTVFVFLVILNISIQVLAKITHKHSIAESAAIRVAEIEKREKNKKTSDTSLIAAIVAAVRL